jgi:P27 family predicted phage terminase small subunit
MVGRNPKPTTLKILEGNPGKRPLPKNEPKPEIDLIPCPDYLKDDAIAYEEWNRIVPELYKLGLLTKVDRAALELYCSQYSIYRDALKQIKEDGLITTNIRNGDKAHPAAQIAREAAKIIKAIAVEFGLTPSSRGRISLPSDTIDDEFEKLLD